MEISKRNGTLLMLITATLWSLGGIFIKLVPWNPLVIAGMRSILAGAVVLLYMRLKKIPLCVNKKSFAVGAFYCGTMLLFVAANKLTTAANAIVLQYTAPIFVLMCEAFIFKKKMRGKDVLTVLITLIGMSLFFFDSLSLGNMLGNVLAILAGVCFGFMMAFSGNNSKEHSMSGIFIGNMLTFIAGGVALFFFETPITAPSLLYIFILGVFQIGVPYVLYGIASRSVPALSCSLISMLEPLLNPLWVFLFTGEAPGAWAFIGGAVVILAVTLRGAKDELKKA